MSAGYEYVSPDLISQLKVFPNGDRESACITCGYVQVLNARFFVMKFPENVAACSDCGHCMVCERTGFRDLTRAEAKQLEADPGFKTFREQM